MHCRQGRGAHWRLTRRAMLITLGAAAALPLLAACGNPSGSTQATTSAPQLHKLDQFTSTSAATASSSTARAVVEPRGKVVWAHNTTISPAWLDPQEYPPQVTPYVFGYAVHDALVKHMPGKPFAPSLAESYEIAQDYKSATFKLRQGITFHDGSPVTPEDVKFTFEQYRGANASILHEKVQSLEIVDNRTVRFTFKAPFLDFLLLYGSPASGAGWVVPRAYYQKVGPNGFKQKPIGAGPYRVVRQQAGTELELEAFTDYWRKVPAVKTLLFRGVPEDATRMAVLQTGEADGALAPAYLSDVVKKSPNLLLKPTRSSSQWVEVVPDRPDSPLKDVRVRQAISLTMDRQALNQAQYAGYSPIEGNWIPEEYEGALKRPVPPTDVAKAKQLLAEAGVPNGFEVSTITPLPPNGPIAERVASWLAGVGIRTQVQNLERGTFYERLHPGPNRLKGFVIPTAAAPGDAASRIREIAMCSGMFSSLCDQEIDSRMQRYDASADPQERQKLLTDVQAYILDNYLIIPLVRSITMVTVSTRIANPEQVVGAIPQYGQLGPYEDVLIKA